MAEKIVESAAKWTSGDITARSYGFSSICFKKFARILYLILSSNRYFLFK